MSDLLKPNGTKKNHKKGFAAADRARKRAEAEERQKEFDKLPEEEKAPPGVGSTWTI